MLIYLLVLLQGLHSLQQLCYDGKGNSYSGYVNVTAGGEPCDNWSQQELVLPARNLPHNYCRMLLQMSSGPFCVYKGQKQSCDVPPCDKSAVLFTGAGITVSRKDGATKPALAVLQQITFYFKVDSISNKEAVLVEVRSAMDESQYFSIRLQNGYVKLKLMLDSYREEVFYFGGPVNLGDVHYVSVNRQRQDLVMKFNTTVTNATIEQTSNGPTNITDYIRKQTEEAYLAEMQKYNITVSDRLSNTILKNKNDTNILVAPYTILVGQGYKGCMAGLSVGTWVKQNALSFDLSVDRPLNLYGGVDLGEYTIKRSQLSEPALTQCMYAPNTYIEDVEYVEPIIEINESEVGSGEKRSLPGGIDLTSIVIISSALGFIFILTGMTVYCMRRNRHSYTPQGYNLEVM